MDGPPQASWLEWRDLSDITMPLTQHIETKILILRGQKVLLSTHLAELYGVLPKALVQAVKRNAERFPSDFMFQLNDEEFANLKSQTVTSSWGGSRRAAPYAFTEQGVAMLSTVLRSSRAVLVNIEIMRTFVRLRQHARRRPPHHQVGREPMRST